MSGPNIKKENKSSVDRPLVDKLIGKEIAESYKKIDNKINMIDSYLKNEKIDEKTKNKLNKNLIELTGEKIDIYKKVCKDMSELAKLEVLKEYSDMKQPLEKLVKRTIYKDELYKKIHNKGLDKYVKQSFSKEGRLAQPEFNKYLRENVWCRTDLSNEEKVDITRANFEKLKPEQKVDFNVIGDHRVLSCPDYSDWGKWPPINWPKYLGLDPYKEIKGATRDEIGSIDRIGSISGTNFAILELNGKIYTMDERAIPYIENEYAYHQYNIDEEKYFKVINCLINKDCDGINEIIKDENKKNGTNIKEIDEKKFKRDYINSYEDFINDVDVEELSKEGIDVRYGLMGITASMNDIYGNEIYSGGAKQLNIPISGELFMKLGVLVESNN